MRPFLLEGQVATLPAGAYRVDTKEGVFDGMVRAGHLRTSARNHLHGKRGTDGVAPTLTIFPREDPEMALARAMSPAAPFAEPDLGEMMTGPVVRLVMHGDENSEADIRGVFSHISNRRLLNVIAER